MRRAFCIMFFGSLLAGCAEFSGSSFPDYPSTPAEVFAGYSYVPLDPLPVDAFVDENCKQKPSILSQLPDNAVRIAVRKLSGAGSLGFGPAQVGVQGNSYQVILDYINADVSNMRFKYSGGDVTRGGEPASLTLVDRYAPAGTNEFVIPVYVGIGLRLTANVTVRKGTVNLGSLGALSAAAEAEKLTGSLIVQTLGITGKQVTSSLPLPSELNPTTIQNAIQSLGSVKAIVYDEGNTIVTPRVTGIYNPLPSNDQKTINLIVSELARQPIPWWQRCAA